MEAKDHLFDAFPAISKEQWIQQVIKDLKGGDFDTILKYTSRDGIDIYPFYTAEDLSAYSERKPLFAHTDWDVCEEIVVTDENTANKQALDVLENGATALLFRVPGKVSVSALLQDIGIEYIGLQFVVSSDIALFDEQLQTYISDKGLQPDQLNLSIAYDPIHAFVTTGSWDAGVEKDLFTKHTETTSNYRNVCIDGTIYHNAGAAPAYEIACIAAHANEYLNWLSGKTNSIQLHIAIGQDYFFEIAKMRAIRKVFALLSEAYGIRPTLYIHAETAIRNLTVYDAHNNLLRTTTEAMAATIGGCNSLTVKPFDEVYSADNSFSDRLARNIQLILKAESYFDKVADVSAGSYFIEALTEQLAEKAWSYFKEIEATGAFISSFEQNIIQQTVEASANSQQQRFEEGKEILVGTNKYPDAKQVMKDQLKKDIIAEQPATSATATPLIIRRLSVDSELKRLALETAVS